MVLYVWQNFQSFQLLQTVEPWLSNAGHLLGLFEHHLKHLLVIEVYRSVCYCHLCHQLDIGCRKMNHHGRVVKIQHQICNIYLFFLIIQFLVVFFWSRQSIFNSQTFANTTGNIIKQNNITFNLHKNHLNCILNVVNIDFFYLEEFIYHLFMYCVVAGSFLFLFKKNVLVKVFH